VAAQNCRYSKPVMFKGIQITHALSWFLCFCSSFGTDVILLLDGRTVLESKRTEEWKYEMKTLEARKRSVLLKGKN
jgi:hypothetical protein